MVLKSGIEKGGNGMKIKVRNNYILRNTFKTFLGMAIKISVLLGIFCAIIDP